MVSKINLLCRKVKKSHRVELVIRQTQPDCLKQGDESNDTDTG